MVLSVSGWICTRIRTSLRAGPAVIDLGADDVTDELRPNVRHNLRQGPGYNSGRDVWCERRGRETSGEYRRCDGADGL